MKKFMSVLFDELLNDAQRTALVRIGFTFTAKVESGMDGDFIYDVMWWKEVEAKNREEFDEWESREVYGLPEFQE